VASFIEREIIPLSIEITASCAIGVNGRTENRRTTEKHYAAVYCWRWHKSSEHVVVYSVSEKNRPKCFFHKISHKIRAILIKFGLQFSE